MEKSSLSARLRELPRAVTASTNKTDLSGADVVFLAVPTRAVPEVTHALAPYLRGDVLVITFVKGFHKQLPTLNQALAAALPGTMSVSWDIVCVLSTIFYASS